MTRHPIQRKTHMKRGKPLRRVSKKRAAELRQYAVENPLWAENQDAINPWCPVAWSGVLGDPFGRRSTDTHHKNGREGKKLLDFSKCMRVSRAGHDWIAAHSNEARKRGLKWNTKSIRPGFVDMWIGFSHDEWHRCSDSDVGYIRNTFPFVERKTTKEQVSDYYLKHGIPKPPRSVCAACFSNGLDYFKEQYEQRPNDWQKSVDVDNAVESWHERGITQYPVFVSASLIRLRDMPAMNFGAEREDLSEHHCNSGVCFL